MVKTQSREMEEHEHRRCIRRAKASSQLREDAKDGVTSGASTPKYEPECRCLPILEREVGPFGSTSTTGSGPGESATSSISDRIPRVILSAPGEDNNQVNGKYKEVRRPISMEKSSKQVDTESQDGWDDPERSEFWNVENKKRGVVNENYDFNLDPNAKNRVSGCPSPKTSPSDPSQSPNLRDITVNEDLISPNTSPQLAAEDKGKQREQSQPPSPGNNNPDIISYTPVLTPANKSLLQLFSPLYDKRSKIITYNETEHVIRVLQNTPSPGSLSRLNTFQAKFQISHHPSRDSRKSLQGLLNIAATKANEATKAAQNSDNGGEGSSRMVNVPLDSIPTPPIPPAPHSSFATYTERKQSEADIASELSNLQLRNESLYKELLLPITIPESIFSQEHTLLVSRWTDDIRMTPKQAEKQWEKHVKETLDEAVEALRNQQDNIMFKRNGLTSTKQDEVLVQLAKDEVVISKGRERWYKQYKKNIRREKWAHRRERVRDALLCRSIERDREGALGEVLRKMSDDEQIPGVSAPARERVSR